MEDTLAAAAKSRGAETVTVAPATAADARAAVDEAVAKTTAAVVVVLVRLPGPAAVADAAAAKTAFEANGACGLWRTRSRTPGASPRTPPANCRCRHGCRAGSCGRPPLLCPGHCSAFRPRPVEPPAAPGECRPSCRPRAPASCLPDISLSPPRRPSPQTAPTPELKSERLRRDTSSDSDSSTNKDKQKSRVAQRVLIDNYIWFSTPVLMGAVTLLIVTPPFIIGLYWLFIMQTPDRFADPNDKCLQVAAN